jgi:superfamily I DNA/RNA helicase
VNHRNTVEICQFAAPLLDGLDVGDDGTFPDFTSCTRHGRKPTVIKGLYSSQVAYAIEYIRTNVDLANESVGFLKPLGGGWFATLRAALEGNGLEYVDLTRRDEWPKGRENIAICTMNSAKGLEFDHVIMLGLSSEVTPHDSNPDDNAHLNLRRLLAMAATRARESIVLGYKPGEESALIQLLDPDTYDEVDL